MSGALPSAATSVTLSQYTFCQTGVPRSITITTTTSSATCRASVQAFAESDSATGSRRSASLYEILRIGPNASPFEIKSAYRRLAKRYHPDSLRQSESGGQHFIEIHNAYATLSDPAARSVYDLSLEVHRRRTLGYSVGQRSGVYRTRSWETDQCW